jgi:hypothetical protein
MKAMSCKDTTSSNNRLDNNDNCERRQPRVISGTTEEAHSYYYIEFDKRSLLIATIMALVMSSIMSFIIVSFNVYFSLCNRILECFMTNSFAVWPRSFLLAFVLGIPIILVVSPFVRRIVGKILN